MSPPLCPRFVCATVLSVSLSSLLTASSLEWIELPPEVYSAEGYSISADGTAVSGHYFPDQGGVLVFWWTANGGFQPVDFGSNVGRDFRGTALNANGLVMVGNPAPTGYYQAHRWSSGGGPVASLGFPFGYQSSQAFAVDAAGDIVAGAAFNPGSPPAAVVRRTSPIFPYDDWTVISNYGESLAISNNGEVVVGWNTINNQNEVRAFRWTGSGGKVNLPTLGGITVAYGVSANGNVIVGRSDDNASRPFRWTAAGGMVSLSSIFEGIAYDTDASGSIVVGGTGNGSLGNAFIWDSQSGMRMLKDRLIEDGVTIPTGWEFTDARAISDDGTKIVGWGLGPHGNNQPFIATLGPPAIQVTGMNIYRDESGIPVLEWSGPDAVAFRVQYDDDMLAPWTDSTIQPLSVGEDRWQWKDEDEALPARRFYRIAWTQNE